MDLENLTTLINCPEKDCCGCLNGKLNKKAGCIDFWCNECNKCMGYIDLKGFKKFIKTNKLTQKIC